MCSTRQSLEGNEPASEKTYRDHDDRWMEFSWVLVDGSAEPEVYQGFPGPLYPRAFVYLCYTVLCRSSQRGDAYLLSPS